MRKKDFFLNESYCELIITSKVISPQIITQELGIVPNRQYIKGEEFSSKHSGTIGKRFQNLWALKSEPVVSEKEDISNHILFFKNLLESKIQILRKYKIDERYEVAFWIWVEIENTGIGIELAETETSFLNSISNSIRFTLLTKKIVS